MTIRVLHAVCLVSISITFLNFEGNHARGSSRLASAFQPHLPRDGRNIYQQVSREFTERRALAAGGQGPLHSIVSLSSDSPSDGNGNDHLKLSPQSSYPAELVPYTQQDQYLRETAIDKDSQLYISLMVYFRKLNEWYTNVNSKVRCPFFRRRFSDAIDSLAMMGRFLVIRHKSVLSDPSFTALLGYEYTVPGCLPLNEKVKTHNLKGQDEIHAGNQEKLKGLSLESVENLIKQDWLGKHPSGSRGYYITGKLSSQIYRNDCFFNGPDPDMPVRGLRKYLSAAAHLFDQGKSHAEMLDISRNEENRTVTVKWLLGGILMLPWRPKVNDWTGSTTYFLDPDGLIYKHNEEWNISVWEAFISTAFPGVGHMVWGGTLPFLQ
jgi:hypothetical protein